MARNVWLLCLNKGWGIDVFLLLFFLPRLEPVNKATVFIYRKRLNDEKIIDYMNESIIKNIICAWRSCGL